MPDMPDVTLPRRSEIPIEQTWDLASAYPSDAAWEDAARESLAAVPSLSQICAHLLGGAFQGQSTLATARGYSSALDAPLDALAEAGADLTTPEPLERAFAPLAAMLDELEGMVGEDDARY